MPAGRPSFAKFGPEKREQYLRLLREGNHRYTAARGVGVSPELVRLYRRATEGWERQEEEAEQEACGQVEDALFQAAVSGNVTACQVWLYNRTPDRWKDQRNFRLTGLEDVLSRLPPDFAREVRRALAAPLPGGSGAAAPGVNGGPGRHPPAG